MADPELLIKTHFPENSKWQLTKKKYSLNEFLKWPLIKSRFYEFGFKKFFPNEGLIILKNTNGLYNAKNFKKVNITFIPSEIVLSFEGESFGLS